ncbi:MAG: MFS transporter [Erysipelotrichaceae bacterium]|nr:MFS transporter [Erysipelotrichaceae bacterium]
MNPLEKKTVMLNTVFNFGATLVSQFISVYLYIYTGSLPLMCLYIIVRIGLFPIFFMLGNHLSKRHSFTLTYTLGLVFITLGLVFSLLAGPLFEANPFYVLIVAAIIGSGEGFYYFSANTCNQIVSSVETRASFLAYNGIFSNITSLLAPIFSSFVLANTATEMEGYRFILFSIIIIFIFVIFMALSMSARSRDKDSSLLKALSLKDKVWRDHCIAVFFYGLRDGVGLNVIGLLIYEAAGSGGTYSKLQTLFSFIMIFSYYLLKKVLRRDRIERTMKIGVLFKILSTYSLIFVPNTVGAIFYGIGNAMAAAFYDNSYSYLSANIIGRYANEMTARIVAKETYLSLARCTSMALVILAYFVLPKAYYLQISVTLITLSTIVVTRILLRYKS